MREPFPEPVRRRWTAHAAVFGVSAVAVLVVVHIVNHVTVDWVQLDLNQEQTFMSWCSTFGFALAGLMALVAGLERREWLAVGAFLLLFSLDDVAMIHENLEARFEEGVMIDLVEPLVALAVAAAFVLAARTVDGLSRLLLIGGLVALAVAQATSSIGFFRDELGIPLGVLVVVEEGGELLVGALVAAAAVDPLLRAVNAVVARRMREG